MWFDATGPHTAWRVHLRAERGPRTGTGVYSEIFGGRRYVGIICRRCTPRRDDRRLAGDVNPRIERAGAELVYFI